MKKISLSMVEQGITYVVLALFMLLYLMPVNPGMPSSGLDPSWSNVINYAFINDMSFGKDLYFTYGPLGSFRFPGYVYAESSYYTAIVLSIFIALIVATSLFMITRKINLLGKTLGIIAIFTGLINDGLFFWYLIPILFVIITFEKDNEKIYKTLSFLLLAVLSFSVVIKFSHFPTAILSVLFIDGYFYYKFKQKVPLYMLLFFAFMIVFYTLSGQNIFDFYDYFIGSFNTLSGYSEAMNTFGPSSMIYIFLALFIGMYILLLKVFYDNRSLKLFLVSLTASLVLFMAFKQGFVRHDGHATAAFSGMAFVFGLFYLYYYEYFKNNIYKFIANSLLILSIIFSFTIMGFYKINTILAPYIIDKINSGLPTKEVFKSINRDKFVLVSQMTNFHDFYYKIKDFHKIFDSNRIVELNQEYKNSMNSIKEKIDLSGISGTVDIYPWDQSYIIANELKYQPRPLFQSYSVYTPKLIENNIEFLRSEKAPDNILFQIKEIDERLPSTMESASWIEILKRYETVGLKNNFLHMKKRTTPRVINFKNTQTINSKFNEIVNTPYDNAFVKIKFKKSLFGSIINTLFKSPILWIKLEFSDGSTIQKRIIPQISSSGFILTPYIDNIYDFHMYEIGKDSGKRVESFKIINEQDCCYNENFDVTFEEINIEKESSNKNIFLEIEQLKNNRNLEFINSFNISQKFIKNTIEKNSELKIEFGFLPLSIDNFKPTLGCFKIDENRLNQKIRIFDKCFLNHELKGMKDFVIINLENNSSTYEFNIFHESEAWELGYWKIGNASESK